MFSPVESQLIFLSRETPIVSVDLRTAEVPYTNQNKRRANRSRTNDGHHQQVDCSAMWSTHVVQNLL